MPLSTCARLWLLAARLVELTRRACHKLLNQPEGQNSRILLLKILRVPPVSHRQVFYIVNYHRTNCNKIRNLRRFARRNFKTSGNEKSKCDLYGLRYRLCREVFFALGYRSLIGKVLRKIGLLTGEILPRRFRKRMFFFFLLQTPGTCTNRRPSHGAAPVLGGRARAAAASFFVKRALPGHDGDGDRRRAHARARRARVLRVVRARRRQDKRALPTRGLLRRQGCLCACKRQCAPGRRHSLAGRL